MNRKLLAAAAILMCALPVAYVVGQAFYVSSIGFVVNPLFSAETVSVSLPTLTAGDAGTITFNGLFSWMSYKNGQATISLSILNSTQLQATFSSLTITLRDGGGIRATLSLASPTTTYTVTSPAASTWNAIVDYATWGNITAVSTGNILVQIGMG